MKKENDTYLFILEKLHEVRQKDKMRTLYIHLFHFVSISFILFLCLVSIEALYWFPPKIRFSLWIVLMMVTGFLLLGYIGWPLYSVIFLKKKPDHLHIALTIGQFFSHIKDNLADAIQVYQSRKRDARRTSESLAIASLESMSKKIQPLDFKQVVSNAPLIKSVKMLLVVFCIWCGFFGFFPGTFGSAMYRLIHFKIAFDRPTPFHIRVSPGNVKVIYGDDVNIQAIFEGGFPTDVRLNIQQDETSLKRELHSPYQYTFASIKKGFSYYIQGDKVRSQVFTVEVVRRPMVRHLQLTLVHPDYSKMGSQILESNKGDVYALKGTRVRLSLISNKPLSKATVHFKDSENMFLSVNDQKAKGSFSVHNPDRYFIELEDTLGLKNIDPIMYSIHIQTDMNPVARVLLPGKDVDIDDSMFMPLTLEGDDDFGISQCRLGYWIKSGDMNESVPEDTHFTILSQTDTGPKRISLNPAWDLNDMDLLPQDVVYYFFEVYDNDFISGPKRGRSKVYTARFPSIYEIFNEVEEEQSMQEEKLSDILESSRLLQEELKQVSDEMKSGQALEWEERKKVEQMADQQQHLHNEVQNLEKKLDGLIQQMEQFDLVSIQTLQKYQELQELYKEMTSPELLKAMEQFQDMLEQVDERILKKAMENFQFSQEAFLKSIERTISLLKRVQIEQKLDELVKCMEDLIERQEQVNQGLNQMTDERKSDLQREQEGIEKDVNGFQDELKKLYDKMQPLRGMPLSEMENVIQKVSQEELMLLMQQMQQMMKSEQYNEAMNAGNQSVQSMRSIRDIVDAMKMHLQQEQKKQVVKSLERNTFRLIQLSQGQETLTQDLQNGKETGGQGARRQMSLLSGLRQVADSLYQLAQTTFFVTPELGKALGMSQAEMQQSLQNRSVSSGRPAAGNQNKAIGALNQAVIALENALDQLSDAGSGLGKESFFLQLEQMGMKQQALNQMLQDLLGRGELSLQEQAAMARLAAEQEALKRTLEEALKQLDNSSNIPGRLDQLTEEMEEVIETLKANKANRETVRKQERILSRLLDAQRSVKQRDYEKRRKARMGKDTIRKGPDDLIIPKSEIMDKIRKELLLLGEEGYTKTYQELIRNYFEALFHEKKQHSQ